MGVTNKTYLDLNGLSYYDSKMKEYIPITHGYYSNGNFYSDSTLTTLITGEAKRLYIDLRNNGLYEYINNAYVAFGGGGGGTSDYDDLTDKPSINSVTLSGNKTSSDLGLQSELTFDDTPTDGSNNPVKSNGIYDALADKVDKVAGKGLSENDYTTTEKNKLANIASGAEVNVQSDWDQTDTDADDYIKNKPSIPAAQVNSDWNAASGVAQILNKPTLGTASSKDVATTGNASTTQVVMGNDTRLSDARQASDVYTWAKAATKPSYNASEVGAIPSTDKGANGGVAELDSNGKVPSSQLPSYVDDVLSYASQSAFPATGETGKIYIAEDTNKTYRWSGSAYAEISESLALGETSSTAYRGDRGKTAYDHSQLTSGNPHGVTKSDVGLGNVPNVATNNQTPTFTVASTRANIASGEKLSVILGKIMKFFTDLKTVAFSGSYDDLSNKPTIPDAQIQSDWNQTTTTALDYIKNKPTIPAAQVNSDWNATSGVAQILNKPSSYTPSSHTHGNIQNAGTLQTTDVAIANGDKLVVTDASNSAKVARTSLAFDGSTTTQALSKKGTFETFSKFSGSYDDLTNKPPVISTTSSGKAITALTGTGTAGQDKGSGSTNRYVPTLWTFSESLTATDGEVYFIKIPETGGTYGVWLAIDGTNYHPVAVSSAKGRFTTQYAKNTVIAVTYESAGVCSCYAKTGADAVADVTGCFRVLDDYDANTTYSNMSVAELLTGTATNARVSRSDYLKKGIIGLTGVAYGTCDTAAATAKKVVTIADTNWRIRTGAIVGIKFTNTNTANNPTFNVNNSGDKTVFSANGVVTTGRLNTAGAAGYIIYYMFDGTNWCFINWGTDNNTTYTPQSLGFGYGTCTTAAATAAKVATLSGYALVTNGFVSVRFSYDVPASATLNINSKGAKAIYNRGAAIAAGVIKAGDIATFVYSGQYHLISINRPIDTTPTASSNNLITSGGVKTALDEKAKIFSGTETQWNNLTTAQKKTYDYAVFTDI